MKEKTFGELKIGDKIYTFNINKGDNRIIKEGKIESIDDVFYIIDFFSLFILTIIKSF